jgi:hypothetical protein
MTSTTSAARDSREKKATQSAQSSIARVARWEYDAYHADALRDRFTPPRTGQRVFDIVQHVGRKAKKRF